MKENEACDPMIDNSLSFQDRVVFMVMINFKNWTMVDYKSYGINSKYVTIKSTIEYLSESLEISVKEVKKSLKALDDHGYIHYEEVENPSILPVTSKVIF